MYFFCLKLIFQFYNPKVILKVKIAKAKIWVLDKNNFVFIFSKICKIVALHFISSYCILKIFYVEELNEVTYINLSQMLHVML